MRHLFPLHWWPTQGYSIVASILGRQQRRFYRSRKVAIAKSLSQSHYCQSRRSLRGRLTFQGRLTFRGRLTFSRLFRGIRDSLVQLPTIELSCKSIVYPSLLSIVVATIVATVVHCCRPLLSSTAVVHCCRPLLSSTFEGVYRKRVLVPREHAMCPGQGSTFLFYRKRVLVPREHAMCPGQGSKCLLRVCR
jgi:hypothetical protein